MHANRICRSCLRTIAQQTRAGSLKQRPLGGIRSIARVPRASTSPRVASTTIRHYASNPAPNVTTSLQDVPADDTYIVEETEHRMQEGSGPPIWEQYQARDACEVLFKECARQADYIVPQAFERKGQAPKNEAGEDVGEGTGWWYEELGLIPTFNTWAQVTMLHMYILTVRLRYFPPQYAQIWLQQLHDHFFFEAEHRMTLFHAVSARAIRNRYLKDLYNQWRGVQGAFDEALVRGDAVLGAAVWRNVFKGKEDVDWTKVAIIVSFMRRGIAGLDKAKDKSLLGAMVKFGTPAGEAAIVDLESRGMKEPFNEEDEVELKTLMSKK